MVEQQKVKEINNRLIAKTFAGLEFVLAKELQQIGASNVRTLRRGVRFEGNKEMMYKANYFCRTAIRILRTIAVFKAENEQQLYDGIGKIDWEKFIGIKKTFAIDAIVSNSKINHSQYAALKSKDAIADQFRNKYNRRPNVNPKNPDIQINIRIFRDECSVSLDSSGESLHKRGYRTEIGLAPINEVLAAGMVLLSGWDKKSHFLDPMCGSGTIPIEAGMIANNIPSGFYRKHFGFQNWKDFDAELWEQVKSSFKLPDTYITVEGADKSGILINKSKCNINREHLNKIVNLRARYFEDSIAPDSKGVIIINPPYGERLKVQNIFELYKNIGDTLKNNYPGYTAWIITSDQRLLRNIGIRPSKSLTLFNGKLESTFTKFEIFEKVHKQETPRFSRKISDPHGKSKFRKRR